MKYNFSSKVDNCQWTNSMKEITQVKLSKLEKFLDNDVVKIHLENEGESIVVKAQAKTDTHKIIRAESKGLPEVFNSLVLDVCNSLERQCKKNKEKIKDKKKRVRLESSEADELLPFEIVKRTKVLPTSMTEEQAINELEDGGYTWFVFKNIEVGNKLCILNKRLEGNYKLIELE